MKIFLKKNRKIAFLVVFLLLFPFVSFAGFGISPGTIIAKDVLRNSNFEKIFVISRSDPVNDLLISVEAEGNIADWFQFERGSKFTYPAGNRQFPVKSVITVPSDTPNGEYKGSIRFTGIPQQSCLGDDCDKGTSVGVALGAVASVTINVTDKEIKSFRVLGVQIDKAIKGEPVVFAFFLENTGNVRIRPGHIVVDFFDKFHKIQLGSFTVNKFEGWVPVQNSGRVLAEVPYAVKSGNLWAEIAIFNHQNKLIARENLPFDVKKGDGQTYTKSREANRNSTIYAIGGIMLGGIFFFALGFIFIMKYLKKSLKPQITKEELIELIKKENESKISILPDLSKEQKVKKGIFKKIRKK